MGFATKPSRGVDLGKRPRAGDEGAGYHLWVVDPSAAMARRPGSRTAQPGCRRLGYAVGCGMDGCPGGRGSPARRHTPSKDRPPRSLRGKRTNPVPLRGVLPAVGFPLGRRHSAHQGEHPRVARAWARHPTAAKSSISRPQPIHRRILRRVLTRKPPGPEPLGNPAQVLPVMRADPKMRLKSRPLGQLPRNYRMRVGGKRLASGKPGRVGATEGSAGPCRKVYLWGVLRD